MSDTCVTSITLIRLKFTLPSRRTSIPSPSFPMRNPHQPSESSSQKNRNERSDAEKKEQDMDMADTAPAFQNQKDEHRESNPGHLQKSEDDAILNR